MKIVIAAQPWLIDPSLVPLPWRDEKVNHQDIGSRTLRIGVMWHDGVVKPHPPISRALKEVVDKLKDVKNIEIIEWKPYKHDLCWEIIVSTNDPKLEHANRNEVYYIFPRWRS